MENSKREIESFLYLYPSAIKYYDSIKYNVSTHLMTPFNKWT